jgi:hypothetical protein
VTPEEWKAGVKLYLERIADRRYQELVWFDRPREDWKDEVSNPNELIALLFDDWQFEDFVSSPLIGLSSEEQQEAQPFVRAVREFSRLTPQPWDHREIIDNPRWQEIRTVAQRVLGVLDL